MGNIRQVLQHTTSLVRWPQQDRYRLKHRALVSAYRAVSARTYLRGDGRQQQQRQLEEGHGELQTRSGFTSLGHAPAMGPHLAWLSGPAEGRANLLVELCAPATRSLTKLLWALRRPWPADVWSQRSIGAACVELKCVVDRLARLVFPSWLPGIHIHPLVTNSTCCPATFERPAQTPSGKVKRVLPSLWPHHHHALPVISMTSLPARPMRPLSPLSLPLPLSLSLFAAIACPTTYM